MHLGDVGDSSKCSTTVLIRFDPCWFSFDAMMVLCNIWLPNLVSPDFLSFMVQKHLIYHQKWVRYTIFSVADMQCFSILHHFLVLHQDLVLSYEIPMIQAAQIFFLLIFPDFSHSRYFTLQFLYRKCLWPGSHLVFQSSIKLAFFPTAPHLLFNPLHTQFST